MKSIYILILCSYFNYVCPIECLNNAVKKFGFLKILLPLKSKT